MSTTFRASGDVIVRTPQFENAAEFYGGVLGLPVVHHEASLIGFNTGRFTLYVEPGAAHGAVFEFRVADFAAARLALLAAGCEILEEDAALPRCYVRDPYGLTFNIAQTRDAGPPPR